MLSKARIAVLVSGGGTNLEALLDAQAAGGTAPRGDRGWCLQQRRRLRPGAGADAGASRPIALPRKAAGTGETSRRR